MDNFQENISRNFGLDIVRCIAIILVIINHVHLNLPLKDLCGYLGVNLFFVLSGFLIGQILLKEFVQKDFNMSTLINFWKRRWFRTLPLYYLFLMVAFFFLPYAFKMPSWFLSALFFLQNFSPNTAENDYLLVSWSLVIEEWFYLTFPLLLIIFKIKFKNKLIEFLPTILILFIYFIFLYRIIYTLFLYKIFYIYPMKNVFLRFDMFAIGILLAYFLTYRQDIFNILRNKFSIILAAFSLYLMVLQYSIHPNEWIHRIFASTLGMEISALISIVMISCLYNIKTKAMPLITLTSQISYALYLCHSLIFSYLNDFKSIIFSRLEIFAFRINVPYFYNFVNFIEQDKDISLTIAGLIISISLSILLYKFYEKPIMDLRDKSIKEIVNNIFYCFRLKQNKTL